MIVLICDKCYHVFGCRPHYHPIDVLLAKVCEKCPVWGFCEIAGKSFYEIKVPDTIEEGYCPSCIRKGGGL